MSRIIVTGGLGFIGSNFIRLILNENLCDVVLNIDKQTYAGNPENLSGLDEDPRYEFIKSELGEEVDISKIETNLASIINVLSNEEWDDSNKIDNIDSFEIERKIVYNKLDRTRLIITENALFYSKVDSIYKEFDKQGLNKSNSVLGKIKREFLKLFDKNDPDGSFQKTVDILVSKVTESINFDEIPLDELELCIEILTVDAFIRCKIFNNPKNYKYATT